MRTDLFDFDLPPNRIALRPASPRDAARLLVVGPGEALLDRTMRELPEHLRTGDVLVVNDTRVIPAQLSGRRIGRGSETVISATLIKRLDASRWQALVKGAKKLQVGDTLRFGHDGRVCLLGHLDAAVEHKADEGAITLSFSFHGPALDQAIADVGVTPLPPYIAAKRPADEQDASDYQTLFALEDGAVAAPTAGLHFTPELEAAIRARGVGIQTVDDTSEHRMHSEWGRVTRETAAALNAARAAGGRIVAVGTTSLRLLESAADENGVIRPFDGETAIFITPGYHIRAVDLLMTNFHLPRSTLFMLVSAFAGLEAMQRAYAHAIAGGYRFYSYGDGSLLHRAAA
jgi:S-adenosylmethionine:tRNA ribosyltransferase-isomerase